MKVLEEKGASFTEIRALADKIPNQTSSGDLVPCPHCGRKFAPCKNLIMIRLYLETADRHIPKCATTINKPKPPPQLRAAQKIYGNARSPF